MPARTGASRITRHRLIFSALAAVIIAAAAGLLVWSTLRLVTDEPAVEWVLLLVLGATAFLAQRIPFEFGQDGITVDTQNAPLLLAAFFIPIEIAVWFALALALVLGAGLIRRFGRFGILLVALACAIDVITISVVCLVAQNLLPSASGGVLILPALAAAVVYQVLFTIMFPVGLELDRKGSGREFIEHAKFVAVLDGLLAAVAVVLLSPYHENAVAILLALAGMQLAVWFTLRIANSEQLQRRRNEHLHAAFSRYVPEGVVSDNMNEIQEVELGGEQRRISVLFCDIRGFTTWSENREPSEIVTELNTLLSELSSAVFEFEGTLDKFTGDGLMAFWGAPLPHEDHAERACRAALEMLRRLEELNAHRIAAGQTPFAMGVGVHTGYAVVGNVGHEKRLDYTAIGDTVNLSARLEAATKDIGSILMVSRVTWDQLPSDLQAEGMRVGSIEVKGRRQEVEVFALKPQIEMSGVAELRLPPPAEPDYEVA